MSQAPEEVPEETPDFPTEEGDAGVNDTGTETWYEEGDDSDG